MYTVKWQTSFVLDTATIECISLMQFWRLCSLLEAIYNSEGIKTDLNSSNFVPYLLPMKNLIWPETS